VIWRIALPPGVAPIINSIGNERKGLYAVFLINFQNGNFYREGQSL
jgi:hypothetical protein